MLPSAQIARPGMVRRGGQWLGHHLLGPRFTSGVASWSFSGAFFAGCALTLYACWRAGALGELDMQSSIGVVIFAGLGMVLLVWPFVLSAVLYVAAWRRGAWRSRAAGALWGAGFHATAHAAVMNAFGAPALSGVIIPIAIGALWGSWLPAVAAVCGRSPFWSAACPACGGRHEPPPRRL